MKLFWIRRGLGILAFGLIFITLAGFAITSLWNWLVPVLFAGPTISFVQALGLLLLSRLLVGFRGGWGGRSGHPQHAYWRQRMSARWQNMTTEERQQFKQQMKEQWRDCGRGYGRRWERETGQTQSSNPPEAASTQP